MVPDDRTPRSPPPVSARTAAGEPPRGRSGPRLGALSDWVERCIAPVLQKQGFAAADVVVAWPDIVGERLARHCEPVKMQWPRRPAGEWAEASSEPATLVVRTEGAFALELQHLAPVLIEKVNARYGWRCVGRIVLRQGPVGRERSRHEPPPVPSATVLQEARRRVGDVADERLREALVQLGAGILARKQS